MLASGGPPRTAYGSVPNPIAQPPNLYSQLQSVPGFSSNTSGTGAVIGSQLAGTVSPQTLNALKTGSAQFGVASGMPGSGLQQKDLFANIAGFSEGQQQKGVQNQLAQTSTLAPTMTNPNLAAEVSSHNADLASAPDPRMAAEQQFNDWLRGFNITQNASRPHTSTWASGGTLGPAGSTTHSNWGGTGMSVPGFTDSLGFSNWGGGSPSYANPPTATATPPVGGWPGGPAPWGSDFATGVSGGGDSFSGQQNIDEFFP